MTYLNLKSPNNLTKARMLTHKRNRLRKRNYKKKAEI